MRYDLHRFETDAERLEFLDSLLADNKYFCHRAEHVQGGVCGLNPMQRVSKAAKEWPVSTIHPGGNNCGVYLPQILSSGEYPQ